MRLPDLRERFVAWALRVATPEPAPVVLGRRRIYVLPSRAGLGFGITLLLLLIGSINYNLALGYLLTFFFAAVGVASIFHAFANLSGLTLWPGRAPPVFAGDEAAFHLLVAGPGRRHRIRLWLAGDETTLLPGSEVPAEAVLHAPSERRGWLALPRVGIDTRHPLGLIRAWSYCVPEQYCLIYPQPASQAPPLPQHNSDAGSWSAEGRGSDDFSGLRDHQIGDPPRHVAWKTAARLGPERPLQTKQFSGATSRRIWLDWFGLDHIEDTETRLAILTRWALDAHAQGITWGLRLPEVTLAPASGSEHLHAALKALALHGQAQQGRGAP